MVENKGRHSTWHSLRLNFWLFIACWVLAVILNIAGSPSLLLAIVGAGLSISTFLFSIICIRKYKQRSFAIVALIISSFYILLMILGFIVGLIVSLAGT